ncbi:hypothetical protein PILCRDRAFT_3572 [Piloderma croceum F 1598]|uniref:Uncharacterized protein n=1 Tax=Piloderma croceum (strain F 1598) TaxID=765440 RepID=A0A0C3BMY3_PILCF|nr:hypothetical protein PILCRDRAFT_3572 [Piloderma croceum F 1598]
MANLAKMNEAKQGKNDSGPSNTSMSTDQETVLQANLEAAQEHAELYERHFRNVTHQVGHAQASKECLEERLKTVQTETATQLAKVATTNESLSGTISSLTETTLSQSETLSDMQQELGDSKYYIDDLTKQSDDDEEKEEEAETYRIKDDQGILMDETHALARNLVQLSVPAVNVNDVIHTVARPMGITMDGFLTPSEPCPLLYLFSQIHQY